MATSLRNKLILFFFIMMVGVCLIAFDSDPFGQPPTFSKELLLQQMSLHQLIEQVSEEVSVQVLTLIASWIQEQYANQIEEVVSDEAILAIAHQISQFLISVSQQQAQQYNLIPYLNLIKRKANQKVTEKLYSSLSVDID